MDYKRALNELYQELHRPGEVIKNLEFLRQAKQPRRLSRRGRKSMPASSDGIWADAKLLGISATQASLAGRRPHQEVTKVLRRSQTHISGPGPPCIIWPLSSGIRAWH